MATMTAISSTARARRTGSFLPAESMVSGQSGLWGTRALSCGPRPTNGPARPHAPIKPTTSFANGAAYTVVTDPLGSVSGRPPG